MYLAAMQSRSNGHKTTSDDYVELNAAPTLSESSTKWWSCPQDSGSFPTNRRPTEMTFTATEVTLQGLVVKPVAISRSQLVQSTGISSEELRHMFLSGSQRNSEYASPGDPAQRVVSACPTTVFNFRQGLLLMNVCDIRAIVDEGRVLVFNQQEGSVEFVSNLQKSAINAGDELRFKTAECALSTIIWRLDSCICKVREISEAVIDTSGTHGLFHVVRLREVELEQVRQQRLVLMKCARQASDVSSALMRILNISQDSKLGELTGEQAEEWITMFELYLQAYCQCSDECTTLLGAIDDFEESATLAMHARRLHIEEFELTLVIGALSIASGSLVPGWMGMNLVSGIEETPHCFQAAIFLTILVSATLFTIIRWLATCRGIFK